MPTLNVNGKSVTVDVPAETPSCGRLRDELGLTGTKIRMWMALCGACTVHLDGVATRSCITPISAAAGKAITTIEAIGGTPIGRKVQAAWQRLAVPQCGYLQSGQDNAGLRPAREEPETER